MIQKTKRFIPLICFVLLFALYTSCSVKANSANTAYAQTVPAVKVPSDSLAALEALQNGFRTLSAAVLPSVVQVDVVETRTVQNNPMEGFPFFFFGQPPTDRNNGNNAPREYKQAGLGSGVIVRRDGNTLYLLTNHHVAGNAAEISIKLYDGRTFKAKLVGADSRKDIALVSFQSDDKSIPIAALGNSDMVQTGDICIAVGTPLGYFSSVTQGIVSATGRSGGGIGNISDFIQTDAAINQGNSGGPLFNIYGEVIGINTWIASQSGGNQGLGFAIPINNVKKSIDDFIKTGKVTYGWLGISLVEATEEYQKSLGVDGKTGALASQVFVGSPAQKGGILPGDFVTALNGKPVRSVEQLVRDVGDLPVGQIAVFTVLRNGKQIEVKVKIEERNDNTVTDNSKLFPGFIPVPITEEIRTSMKLDSKITGVFVSGVLPKSPAAVMGLQNGDVITAVNGKNITNIKELYAGMDVKEIWFDLYRDSHTISTVKYKL